MNHRPIGVFDTGCGGLTTVRALQKLLPQESILYLGDTARMPYGVRPREEISLFSHQITDWLQKQGVKALIAACGTISCNAPELAAELPLPYFDVRSAAAAAAARATRTRRVGLVATVATVKSGLFAKAIEEAVGVPPVAAVGCANLASLIESGLTAADARLQEEVTMICRELKAADLDTLVLGCTHYPLAAEAFAAELGEGVTLIDCGAETAAAAAAKLKELGLLNDAPEPVTAFYFTANCEGSARTAAQALYGQDISAATHLLPPAELTGGE